MIQEIIAFLIIGFAIGITFLNIYRQFNKKKKKEKNLVKHNCKACSAADCTIRDIAIPLSKAELCKENKIESK